MIHTEHNHTHHHGNREATRGNATENIYRQTHRVLSSPRKLRNEGYRWGELTDQTRVQTVRDEIAEIETRFRRYREV